MPTRYTGPRTPRQEKVWATANSGAGGDLVVSATLTPNGIQVTENLLLEYQNELGVSALQRPTAIRIIGDLHLGQKIADDTFRNHTVAWGIAWVRSSVASAPPNDVQIPDPNSVGVRETEWIQRGRLYYRNLATLSERPFNPDSPTSNITLDITQMRKQPTVSHDLVLIVRHQSDGGGISAPGLLYQFHTMLGLS